MSGCRCVHPLSINCLYISPNGTSISSGLRCCIHALMSLVSTWLCCKLDSMASINMSWVSNANGKHSSWDTLRMMSVTMEDRSCSPLLLETDKNNVVTKQCYLLWTHQGHFRGTPESWIECQIATIPLLHKFCRAKLNQFINVVACFHFSF